MNQTKEKIEWLLCPICSNKTRLKVRKDTELINFPLFCPKCKKESLINVNNLKVTIVKEPDAKTAEPDKNEINTISFYRLFPLCMDSFN